MIKGLDKVLAFKLIINDNFFTFEFKSQQLSLLKVEDILKKIFVVASIRRPLFIQKSSETYGALCK